jgi:hypothetical protein
MIQQMIRGTFDVVFFGGGTVVCRWFDLNKKIFFMVQRTIQWILE